MPASASFQSAKIKDLNTLIPANSTLHLMVRIRSLTMERLQARPAYCLLAQKCMPTGSLRSGESNYFFYGTKLPVSFEKLKASSQIH
jgi:hypothetical protein